MADRKSSKPRIPQGTQYVSIGGKRYRVSGTTIVVNKIKYRLKFNSLGKVIGVAAVGRTTTGGTGGSSNKNAPGTTPGGGGGGGGSYYGGGGGGGGSAEMTKDDFIKMAKRVYFSIGLRVNMNVINEAYKKKDIVNSGGQFLVYVRRNDPLYVNSEPGRRAAEPIQKMLQGIFGKRFTLKSVRGFVAKGWNVNQVRDWLVTPQKGKKLTNQQRLFQKLYPYWNQYAKYNTDTSVSSFKQYQAYTKRTNELYAKYFPEQSGATGAELKALFSRDLTPEKVEEGMQKYAAAAPSTEWFTGKKMTRKEADEFILNGKLSNVMLTRLTNAYKTQKGYLGSELGTFGRNPEAEDKLTQNI